MTELEKYKLVNNCEYPKELVEAIILIGSDTNTIHGKTRAFDSVKMASYVEGVIFNQFNPSLLTRSYGIRQQALYLKYYIDYERNSSFIIKQTSGFKK